MRTVTQKVRVCEENLQLKSKFYLRFLSRASQHQHGSVRSGPITLRLTISTKESSASNLWSEHKVLARYLDDVEEGIASFRRRMAYSQSLSDVAVDINKMMAVSTR